MIYMPSYMLMHSETLPFFRSYVWTQDERNARCSKRSAKVSTNRLRDNGRGRSICALSRSTCSERQFLARSINGTRNETPSSVRGPLPSLIKPAMGPDTAARELSESDLRAVSGYKWFLVAVLFVAACLNYADRSVLAGVFPLLREELGMSDVALAATSSFFLWSYAICSPFAGFLGDRFSRSTVITWSLGLWSLIVVLTGLAQTQAQLLGMRIPLGIAESVYVPAAIALIGDHHSSSTRGKAFSLHLCGFYAGGVAGSSLGGYLGQRYGWRCPLFVLGAFGILFAVFMRAVLRDGPKRAQDRKTARPAALLDMRVSVTTILRVRSYWFLVTEAFLVSAVNFVLLTWLPLFFHESFGMDLGTAGFRGSFAMQAGGIAGVMLGGFLSDAVGRRNPARRMLIQACCGLISAPMLLSFLAVPNVVAVELVLLISSFVRFLGAANANPVTCDLIPARHRSLAFGIMNLISCLSAGAGVLLSGSLKGRFGLTAIFASISGIGVLAGLVLLVGYYFFLQRDLQQFGQEATAA